MSRFAQVLWDADARLAVPEPARSRILLEIAADMEDLHREYLGRGLSEEQAHAAVVEHFDLSEEALRDLVQVHDTPLQRSLEQLSGQVRGPWARLLMASLTLLVAGGAGTALLGGQLYRDAGAVVWVVIPVLAWGLVVAGGQGWRIYRKGESWSPTVGTRLGRLLALAILIMGMTGAGLWLELYLSALRIRAAPGDMLVHLVGWLHAASATLVIALSGALMLGFLWFFLQTEVRRRELATVANLMEEVS